MLHFPKTIPSNPPSRPMTANCPAFEETPTGPCKRSHPLPEKRVSGQPRMAFAHVHTSDGGQDAVATDCRVS